jgi:hypothetical protein
MIASLTGLSLEAIEKIEQGIQRDDFSLKAARIT